jgi:hypothetical protein
VPWRGRRLRRRERACIGFKTATARSTPSIYPRGRSSLLDGHDFVPSLLSCIRSPNLTRPRRFESGEPCRDHRPPLDMATPAAHRRSCPLAAAFSPSCPVTAFVHKQMQQSMCTQDSAVLCSHTVHDIFIFALVC